MTNNIKDVFISHIHEDDDGLKDLKNLISKHGIDIRDSSITSEKPNSAKNPDYIKQDILSPQIQWCGTLVVYVSAGTKDSDWVNWEIEYANKLGKRIVGVWAQGQNQCDLPESLEKYGDAVVGWNGENIVDAIIGKSNSWYELDGQLHEYRPIDRYSC